MAQLQKRFSNEQVIFLFQAYEQSLMTREEVQDTLGISRSRFFVLWKKYQGNPETFSIAYQRTTPREFLQNQKRLWSMS